MAEYSGKHGDALKFCVRSILFGFGLCFYFLGLGIHWATRGGGTFAEITYAIAELGCSTSFLLIVFWSPFRGTTQKRTSRNQPPPPPGGSMPFVDLFIVLDSLYSYYMLLGVSSRNAIVDTHKTRPVPHIHCDSAPLFCLGHLWSDMQM